MSEAIKKVHNKLWSRVARKSNTAIVTIASNYLIIVSSLDIIIISNNYFVLSITDSLKAISLLKAIINLLKARILYYFLKDRVEFLRDDNLNKSESNF